MRTRTAGCRCWLVVALLVGALGDRVATSADSLDAGLVGRWTLAGEVGDVRVVRDVTGKGRDGINHGVNLTTSQMNGVDQWVTIPGHRAPRLGSGDLTISIWIEPTQTTDDVPGDVLSKLDSARRKGWQLSVAASSAGYNSTGDSRHVQFFLDNGGEGVWTDCGRPGGKSHSSDALTVFDGHLYAGTSDAPDVEGWAHVYRYGGDDQWHDCGRLGHGRTRGVYAMVVHDGHLYAATSASHGPQPATMSFGRVYRYTGGTNWEDLGQPGENYRLNALASYKGRLYVCGFNIGPAPGHCYVYEGNGRWKACGEFQGWPHAMAVFNGRLYVAYPKGEVFSYDGESWTGHGNPFGSLEQCNQIHSLGVFGRDLLVGTWPKGRIAAWRDPAWIDCGKPGDATEVIGLTSYHGALHAATIPRAEVFRWDGDGSWRSLRRLFDPPGFKPVPVGSTDWAGVSDWSRATSLTVFQDRLFASTGTCHRTMLESPRPDEIRGKVYSYRVGSGLTYDRDIGRGWHHLAVVRLHRTLRLYVDGQMAVEEQFDGDPVDASTDADLYIGRGTQDAFQGRIRDVRLYDRALSRVEIASLAKMKPKD